MSTIGSVTVADDGTVTKSGLAGVYYDAIEVQESPTWPDPLSPSATFSGTAAAWKERVDKALVGVKRGYAREATSMATALVKSTLSGDTGHRPIDPVTGQMYFDTTIGKPIWWNGISSWVLSSGVAA